MLSKLLLPWSMQAPSEQILGVVENKRREQNSRRCLPSFGVQQSLPLIFVARILDYWLFWPPSNVVDVMEGVAQHLIYLAVGMRHLSRRPMPPFGHSALSTLTACR